MTAPSRIGRIGIVSGVTDELAAFLPGVERSAAPGSPLPVQHVSHGGKDIYLLCAGIGKVAAATAATLLHAHYRVDLLAVIGTAGKIGAIEGDVFHIVEAVQADFGAQRSDGLLHYMPGTLPVGPANLQAYAAMQVSDLGLPRARIATSDLFVECADHSARVRDALAATLVDMETASVAQTASLLGIPWIAIKATTDSADGESADSFLDNLHAAARAAAAALERLIPLL